MALNWILCSVYAIVMGSQCSAGDDGLEKKGVVAGDPRSNFVGFKMPLHYPRYTRLDYEGMEEWKLDLLLREYGLDFTGSLDEKRRFAIGAFLWPDQL